MRICFVSGESVNAFKGKELSESDLIVFGFDGIREVNYERELKGESAYFEEVAKLSKTGKNIVVSGCITDTRGHKRKSAVVAECGQLMGVSDMLHAIDGECNSGAHLRVYETKVGKMGIAVAEDLYFPETLKALVLCGSDFIVCPFGEIRNELQTVLLRANAFYLGVSIVLCGKGYCALANAKGELSFSSPQSPAYAEYEIEREYHLVERRRRGEL